MKPRIWLAIALAASRHCLGQGRVVFANLATGLNAPISGYSGQRLTSPNFVADLYYSTVIDAATDTFISAHFNTPFSTTTAGGGGYFLGGMKTLTNVPGGTTIQAQVRVWASSLAQTFEEAFRRSATAGYSQPAFLCVPKSPPEPPPPLIGLTSFGVTPEIICFPVIDQQPQPFIQ